VVKSDQFRMRRVPEATPAPNRTASSKELGETK
jgi:hypothetical protein